MEKEVRVETYGVIKICNTCESGEVLPTGNDSYMPEIKLEHKCINCGDLVYLSEKYPLIKYRIKSL